MQNVDNSAPPPPPPLPFNTKSVTQPMNQGFEFAHRSFAQDRSAQVAHDKKIAKNFFL